MKKENEFFSLSRFVQLLTYDFNNNRIYYITTIPVAMLIMGLFFWSVFPDFPKPDYPLYSSPDWKSKNYIPLLILGYIVFGVFIVGKSFPWLRNSGSVTSYLTLPASIFEKYMVQWVIRVFLFLIIYPLAFQLTANVTADIYLNSYESFLISNNLPMDKLPEIEKFSFSELFGDSLRGTFELIVLICLGVLGASLLFLGGSIFKKWNVFFGPLSILFLIFLINVYASTVSFIIVPDQVNFWSIDFKGSYPVFFKEEVPLIALSATIIGGVGCLACWFSCYFRLKEKQV